MAPTQIISPLQIGLNDVATVVALFLSASAVYLQYKSTKREVGELEIKDIGETTYSLGGSEVTDGMGGEFVTETRFHVRCDLRNRTDGILYIYSIRATLKDNDETVKLTHHSGGLQLDGREQMLDQSFTGELGSQSEVSGPIEATLLFKTSNGSKSRKVTFTQSTTSWDIGD